MKISDIILLAFNNLKRNTLRTVLTMLGVAVGIGTLSSMVSLGRGVSQNISSQMSRNDLFTGLTISSRDFGFDSSPQSSRLLTTERQVVPLTDSTIYDLEQKDEVAVVFPELIKPAVIVFKGRSVNANIKAVPVKMGGFYPFDNIKLGEFYSSESEPCVVLSKNVLNRMGIYTDKISSESPSSVLMPADSIIGADIEIITKIFDIEKIDLITSSKKQLPLKNDTTILRVKGIVETNSFSAGIFSDGIFLPTKTCEYIPCIDLQNVYDIINGNAGKYGKYNSLHVRVKEHSMLRKVKNEAEADGFQVFSIGDKLDDFERVFFMLDSILAAVGIIALVLSVFGIVNTLLMAIYERRKEIGIMKSLGATSSQVKLIFYFEAAMIGFAGGLIGVLCGKIASAASSRIANSQLENFIDSNIEYFTYSWEIVLLSVLFSVVVSIAASIYPAGKASKIDPLNALRRE